MPETATIRCPSCRSESTAAVPVDSCLYFWDCPACKRVIRPKAGDCCVFCSYGSVPCPSKRG